jgi:hypothetical protein
VLERARAREVERKRRFMGGAPCCGLDRRCLMK